MAELFLELFSEEIPARMQTQAASQLERQLITSLQELDPRNPQPFSTPRRIALALEINENIPARKINERGPRVNAPEKALLGFLRKHQASQSDLVEENGFWVLHKKTPPISAADFIAQIMPALLWKFTWPKSQRWGKGSQFTWVRPLHRIVCLLDGNVVPFSLATQDDDGHHLQSSNLSEGHRFLAPGTFEVKNCAQWQETLRKRYVIAKAEDRQQAIQQGLHDLAAKADISLVPDQGLLNEVTGLIEWPVPLLGKIDTLFMDLPAEVMQVSMRVNQRYFALKNKDGSTAPYFAFVANIIPEKEGQLVISGNERVLRARFADARYFWDLDRKTPLEKRVGQLKDVIFHAHLGNQYERVQRLIRLAGHIASLLKADTKLSERAALLCKADLTTGMVGEFPELQGIMGGYYAQHDGEANEVSQAIKDHYKPIGPSDSVPTQALSIVTALADKIDLLVSFFAIGQKPSGSGDPFALRRAALGIIRIIRENQLRLDLKALFEFAAQGLPPMLQHADDLQQLPAFIAERLFVQLRNEGSRYDVLAAVSSQKIHGDIMELLSKTEAVSYFLESEEGSNLLATVKRASNILRIENKKDGPHKGIADPALFNLDEEKELYQALNQARSTINPTLENEDFKTAMNAVATLRPIVDRFFDKVTINDDDANLRKNRLRLLSQIDEATRLIADFNQIEK